MRRTHKRYLAATSVAVLVVSFAPLSAAAQPGPGLSPRTEAQIAALAKAKSARSRAQSKVDSPLLTAAQLHSGRQLPGGVRVAPMVKTDRTGRTTVTLRASVTPSLITRVRQLGGVVLRSSVAEHQVRADIPLSAVEPLAALPEVQRIRGLADTFTTEDHQTAKPLSKPQHDVELRRRVLTALAGSQDRRAAGQSRISAAQGSVVSEGDRAHGADVARAQRHVSGIGITVGVLSDGVDSLQASISSGDLPAGARALPGAEGTGDEGTAMMEIVHDLAPKAGLLFATAATSELDFASNIRALRAAGADVIVDDVIYYDESPFQDGPVAQAVSDVVHDGASYFSSAGNEGNVDDHTSGNYEGDFRSSGRSVGKFAGTAHDFDPGPQVQVEDPVSAGSAGDPAILQWADPLGKAADDYDLYAVDGDGNVVAFSNDVQNGDDDAFEGFYVPNGTAIHLVVVKFAGADRYFQLTVFDGRFVADGALKAYATPGVTRGHSTVPGAFSVAAAPAAQPLPFDLEPGDPANPAGPFPGLFTTAQLSERFTSDGPRRIFFTPAGRQITPGNLTSTGGRVRHNPDLTAADGVSTSLPDFTPFFGTSAAAPHAAALAALALSGHPGLSRARLRSAMIRSAWDIEAPGRDRDTGAGIVSATALLAAVSAKGQAFVVGGDARVTTSTDGDTFLEPGETALVAVPVTNIGDVTAHQVRVRLTTSTPGVTVSPSTAHYGSVLAEHSKASTFRVSASRAVAPGTVISFRARVRFHGSYSPQRHTSSLLVGQPGPVVTASYAGAPVAIPDDTETGASVSLPLHGVGRVSGVSFSIDGSTCSTTAASTTVGLDHTYDRDLIGTLTGPDGTAVELFNRVGESGNNFCRTVFVDSAARSIQVALEADAPFTGSWRPSAPLAAFQGRPGDGTWKLTVADLAGGDTGSIRAVSVHVSGFLPANPTVSRR